MKSGDWRWSEVWCVMCWVEMLMESTLLISVCKHQTVLCRGKPRPDQHTLHARHSVQEVVWCHGNTIQSLTHTWQCLNILLSTWYLQAEAGRKHRNTWDTWKLCNGPHSPPGPHEFMFQLSRKQNKWTQLWLQCGSRRGLVNQQGNRTDNISEEI